MIKGAGYAVEISEMQFPSAYVRGQRNKCNLKVCDRSAGKRVAIKFKFLVFILA